MVNVITQADTVRREGLVVFSYRLACPYAEGATAFNRYYADLGKELQTRLLARAEAFGVRRLQAYLEDGGKKSRFPTPKFTLACRVTESEQGVQIIQTARLAAGGECLWEQSEISEWDLTLTYRIPQRKRRTKKGSAR